MNVVFEDENVYQETKVRESSGMYAWLLGMGLVKNRQQGNILMIIILVVCITTIYFATQLLFGPDPNAPILTEEDSYRAGNPSEIDNSRQ